MCIGQTLVFVNWEGTNIRKTLADDFEGIRPDWVGTSKVRRQISKKNAEIFNKRLPKKKAYSAFEHCRDVRDTTAFLEFGSVEFLD